METKRVWPLDAQNTNELRNKMTEESDLLENDVLIIDYGVGNISSIINALKRLNYTYLVSGEEKDIKEAKTYILPGVGNFSEAISNLKQTNIIATLEKEVFEHKKPILGICLGMQLLAESSEEDGYHQGLGWIPGKVVKIQSSENFKVPHVGWNDLNVKQKSPLFDRLDTNPHFYFDHSYHFQCEEKYISTVCSGDINIVASIQHNNIFGVQFHPEKSQNNGLKLFRGFFNYLKETTC